MIRGIHGLFYSSDPEATRNFFRDQVKLPGSDIGEGWWIFDLAEGDLGVHPAEEGKAGGHDISFYCDDIEGTVAGMKERGVTFTKDIADHGYGLVTYFTAPGGITVQLFQPRYTKGTAARAPAAAPKKAAAKKPAPKKAAAKPAAKKAAPKKAAVKPAARKPAPKKKAAAAKKRR